MFAAGRSPPAPRPPQFPGLKDKWACPALGGAEHARVQIVVTRRENAPSGQEVVLHTAEDGERVLILDVDDLRRVRALRGGDDTWAREGGVQVRPEHVHTDVEIRVRVPL